MATKTTRTTDKATATPQGSAPHPGGLTGRTGFSTNQSKEKTSAQELEAFNGLTSKRRRKMILAKEMVRALLAGKGITFNCSSDHAFWMAYDQFDNGERVAHGRFDRCNVWIPCNHPGGNYQLSLEIISILGGRKEEGLYGRRSNDGSPSSSGSDYSYFLLPDSCSILIIGTPLDASWREARVYGNGSSSFSQAMRKIGSVVDEKSCLECAELMFNPSGYLTQSEQ